MLKTTTIIKDGKLVGVIKLQQEVLENLKSEDALLLTKQINRGDATITTFKLDIIFRPIV